MNVEREIKLRIAPEAARRVWRLLRPAKRPLVRKVHSVYYDTTDQRLRRAGMALRLRRDGRRWLQTLKAEQAAHGGLAVRSEWEIELPKAALDLAAFPRDEILAATGVDLKRLAVRPLFETRFTRRSAMVALDEGARAEAAIDIGSVIARAGEETISELELELKAGPASAVVALVLGIAEPLGLELEVESKAERGYRLAEGLVVAPARKWRKPALAEMATPQEAFAAYFSAALVQVAANARNVGRDRDPEHLHQLRVGLRRLRSALRAFRKVVPRQAAKPVAEPLAELMPALGVARDWDVLCAWLADAAASRPAIGQLLRAANRRRAGARRAAARLAASRDFQRFLLAALAWLHQARLHGAGREPLARFGSDALERLHRKALKGGRAIDWRDEARRHALRIRVKRLRYGCEFFAACFPRASVRPFVKRLEALQDLLGELNDIAVARSLIAGLAPRGTTSGSRQAATLARRLLAARERSIMEALAPAWRDLEKRSPFWRRPAKGFARAPA